MEPEPIVLYKDPLLLCAEETEECAFVLKAFNNDNAVPNPTLIIEPNFYQIDGQCSEHFSTGNSFRLNDELSCGFEDKANHTTSNTMIQIFYKNVPKDQPEFVDVNNLTSFECASDKTLTKENIVETDDENDVIFVKEYKKEDIEQIKTKNYDSRGNGIRRNPVRQARSNKGKRHLQKEHILEEDFAFLEQFDDENLMYSKSKSTTEPSVKQAYKEWPINVFERPEYNPLTKKIEAFDYTIRDIDNKQSTKKPRLETCIKEERKPKKKYVIKKRKPNTIRVVAKVAVKDLINVVTITYDMVRDLVQNSEVSETGCFDLFTLLRNQTALMALVTNYEEKDVSECLKKLYKKKENL